MVNPCASIIASVQPSRQEASSSSARRLLVRLTYTTRKAPAVLYHSRTLLQGDGDAGPTVAGGEIGGERRVLINRD